MSKDPFKKHFIRILLILCTTAILRNMRRIHPTPNTKMRNPLLLTAHPDDESMFFSPFLFYNSPLVMCLSKGNFNNKGEIRQEEIRHLCKSRDWSLRCLDYEDGGNWNEENIMRDVLFECILSNIENIVTFDEKGVSGHKNHISCCRAMKKLEKYTQAINRINYESEEYNRIVHRMQSLKFNYLKSTNIIEKYIISLKKPSYKVPLYSMFGLRNMLYHKSQLLWFRYIYITISSYMNFNEF